MLDAVINAAKIGGEVLLRNFDNARNLKFDRKRANDYVSEVDRLSQEKILEFILKEFPHHAVLAEEEGGGVEGEEYRWIIDPLDGTTNYLHGFPVFCVSVAVEEYNIDDEGFGRIIAGTVLNPVSQDLYHSEIGKGAFKNGDSIRVNSSSDFSNTLLATGFPFREKEYLEEYLSIFRRMFNHCSGIRRAGSAALDLCWTAEGAFDGFWEKGLSVWDMAAGSLIVLEAGGVISDFSGGKRYLETGNIIAGSPSAQKKMLALIKRESKDYSCNS